jgi:hypothetical protein
MTLSIEEPEGSRPAAKDVSGTAQVVRCHPKQ